MFAMPAVDALAAAYPEAEIVLLGSAVHAELLAGRPGPVGSVVVLPEGLGARESEVDRFVEAVGPVDLGVQVHGGGRESNPLLLRLNPTHTVGGRTDDALALTRNLPFSYYQHEAMRALEVVGLAGATAGAREPTLAVTGADLAEAEAALGELDRPLLVVHPGATDPRRRWPAERFAAVAAGVDAEVVLVGTPDEADIAEEVVRRTPGARSLVGQLSVPGLVGVLALARVVVANDSGPRHLAQAVGTATVSVYWVGNVLNAGPFSRARHRVHISWTTRCPVCGQDTTRPELPPCGHEVSHVGDVEFAGVLDDVRELLA